LRELAPDLQCKLFIAFALVFWCLSTFSPYAGVAGDSWGSLLTAQAWVDHGTPELSPYTGRVDLFGHQFFHGAQGVFYGYPPFPAVLEIPLVAVARLAGLQMWDPADESLVHRQMVALTLVGLMALLNWGYRSLFASTVQSLVCAFISIAAGACLGSLGAAFNSQLPAVVFVSWCQLLFLRERYGKGVWSGGQVGVLLALGYMCRPTGAIWIPPALLYVLWCKPRQLAPALLALISMLALYTLSCCCLFGTPVHPYYQGRTLLLDPLNFTLGMVGVLFSPAVGVFVYQPLLLLAFLLGPVLLWRNSLFWSLYTFVCLHWAVVALQTDWWGGATYGSRLTAETVLPLWLIAAMLWRRGAAPRSVWPLLWLGLAWSLWLNLWVAYARVPSHQVYSEMSYTLDPEKRILWDWKLAPFWITAAQIDQIKATSPAELFPRLGLFCRQGFGGLERAGDHLFLTPQEEDSDISFRSRTSQSLQDGSVSFRYSSPRPAPVGLNGNPWTVLPASRRVVDKTVYFRNVPWGSANRLNFSASSGVRIFDLDVQNWDCGQQAALTYADGWGNDEARAGEPSFRWSYGPQCRLRLFVQKAGHFRLSWRGYSGKAGNRLGIWVNGQERAHFATLPTLASPLQVNLALPKGLNLLEFRFQRWGATWSGDQRPLALCFEGLKLTWSP